MKLKKRSILIVIAAALGTVLTVNAQGIMVFDATAAVKQAEEWRKQLQRWRETVEHYQLQMKAYQEQLATATGMRDIGMFVNEAKGLSQEVKRLQKKGMSLNDLLTTHGSMNTDMDKIYTKYNLFDTCNTLQSQRYRGICKQKVVNQALALEQADEVQEKINVTLNDIARLSARIETAKDSKESHDLANAISLKSVQLTTLTRQWEMNVKQSEMRDKLLAQKREKVFREQQLNAPIPTFQ